MLDLNQLRLTEKESAINAKVLEQNIDLLQINSNTDLQSPEKLSTCLWPRKTYFKTFLVFLGFKRGRGQEIGGYSTSLDLPFLQLCFSKTFKNIVACFLRHVKLYAFIN